MRIGIITNTDTCIPLAYTLANAGQQLQVCIFFSPSQDGFTNEKIAGFANQYKLAFTTQTSAEHLYTWLHTGDYEACFVMGYASRINLNLLKKLRVKLYNIHFGPLPGFKGPVPVFWQLKLGVEKLAVAIHELSEKFDAGPVVWLKETENLPHYNYETVNQLLGQLSIEGALGMLSLLQQKMPVPVIARAGVAASYHKRPQLADVLVDWGGMGATEICNLVRAGNPWNKGALTFFNGHELKIMDATEMTGDVAQQFPAGTIAFNNGLFLIYCRDGKAIKVNMFFFNNSFVPAYHAAQWGLNTGVRLG